MVSSRDLPWLRIHEFLLDVGSVREPKEFCVQVVKGIYRLVPYDQARLYFMDDSGKIADEFLIGVDQIWSDLYHEYFSRIDNSRYAVPTRVLRSRYAHSRDWGGVYHWMERESDEFVTDYVRPQRLRYSAGFAFHSADNTAKGVLSLDRTSRSEFAPKEIGIMSIILPQLDNLHQNLFVLTSRSTSIGNPEAQQLLTKRESEIGDLLCRGMTPRRISEQLCLSVATVYRHIANMHAKLGVSNRQELLLKLVGDTRRNEEP